MSGQRSRAECGAATAGLNEVVSKQVCEAVGYLILIHGSQSDIMGLSLIHVTVLRS